MCSLNPLDSSEEQDTTELSTLAQLSDVIVSSLAELPSSSNSQELDGSVVASEIHYVNECVVNDDDNSNVGSFSVQSEEVVATEDTDEEDEESEDDGEMIVPEFVSDEVPIDIPSSDSKVPGHSWPTLEILPGGVIKHADKDEERGGEEGGGEEGEMMYACAKCPQRFKYLFCLVKHVRWHEDEKKKEQGPDLTKLNVLERDLVNIKRARMDVEKKYRIQKADVMERIARAISKLDGDIFS